MKSNELRALAITSLAHFMNDGTFLVFPLLIVYYSTQAHVSIVFLGTLSIIYTLLSGLLSPVIGDFADRHNLDTPLLSLGILLEGIALMLFALGFSFPSLIVLGTVILGIGQAFYHPIGGAILSRIFGKSSGRALGLNGAFGSVGRAVMPTIVTFMILAIGELLGLVSLSLVFVVATFIIFVGLSFYKKGGSGDIRKSKEKLDRIFYKFLFILGVIVFIRSMFITGTTTFTGEFIYDTYHSKVLAGVFLTVGFIGSVFGQPLFGWVTEKKGGRFAFLITSIISVLAFLGFLYFSVYLVAAAAMYVIFTLAAFSAFPVLLGYVSQTFPKSFYTVANSYVWGIGVTVGGAAGNALITALLGDKVPLVTTFYIALVLAVISIILTPLIPSKVRT
ncbi:MFS transporter [Stygiolobus caldivivus]|uniref:MFS transporter n=1 Tax=Stygiolobus caldivivus TaxID=2824673 RepID=A0A8D5U3W3_9CREN|nr:MFS transporter [Stygiolobus caldivivus]BCU68950.1 MFS transporter [Stygiolobus caldivivus]